MCPHLFLQDGAAMSASSTPRRWKKKIIGAIFKKSPWPDLSWGAAGSGHGSNWNAEREKGRILFCRSFVFTYRETFLWLVMYQPKMGTFKARKLRLRSKIFLFSKAMQDFGNRLADIRLVMQSSRLGPLGKYNYLYGCNYDATKLIRLFMKNIFIRNSA